MIMGHYTAHADTGLFPFSYIVEQQNGNYLIPGIALRNVGTLRDIRKWPQRDLRPQPDFHTDLVSFEAFSPYTMEKIRKATMLMEEWLRRMTEDGLAEMTWQGLYLKRSAIERGLGLYRQAWARFIGDQLLKRLQACNSTDHETLYPEHHISPSRVLRDMVRCRRMACAPDRNEPTDGRHQDGKHRLPESSSRAYIIYIQPIRRVCMDLGMASSQRRTA